MKRPATRPHRLHRLQEKLELAPPLVAAALFQPYRPLMAHLVVTRRCNLSCGYCFEYDKVSEPVPLSALKERIDRLAELGTLFVTVTGGEPLLHPHIAEVVSYVRERGMTPAMNSNGFLLSRERIEALNTAGLYAIQISVDGVQPNETTVKTLKPLLPKLRLLAEHAGFRIRINTVLGAVPPHEAVEVARQAIALGFDAKCSLMRSASGAPAGLDPELRRAYDDIRAMGDRAPKYLSESFQDELLASGRVEWRCRAGARTFLVCENGLVHLCQPRMGDGAIPLSEFGKEDIKRWFHTRKSCAPTCPIAFAHQASQLDRFRSQELDDPADSTPTVPAHRLLRRRAA